MPQVLNTTRTVLPSVTQLAGAALAAAVILSGWLLAAKTPLAFEVATLRWLHPGPTADLTRALWRFASALGDIESRALIAAVGLLALRRAGWRALAVATAWLISGNLLSFASKLLVDRARPQVVSHLEQVGSASFPSGHALNATLTWLLFTWLLTHSLRRRWQRKVALGAAATLGLVTGTARIALGVHWPTDVLAGWLLAVAWLALGLPLLARYWPPESSTSMR